MSGIKNVEKAFIVPGLPHLAYNNDGWQELKTAYKKAGDSIAAMNPDVLVIYSSQWISVLGHSFQADPNPKGCHVDENWYFMDGAIDFDFNLNVDVELAKAAEEKTKAKGLATKLIDYEGFPIDTGTIVAMKFLNPENKIPVVIVSSNIYCGREDSETLGKAVMETIAESGKKAAVVNISSLSHRFLTQDIKASDDKIADPTQNEWNQKMLDMLKAGDNKKAADMGDEYCKNAGPEMGFKGFYWMMGGLDYPQVKADVHAYGPIWGTGNAIVEYSFN